MKSSIPLNSWLRFTILTGFAAFVSYGLAAFAPFPEKISLLLAFAFGPLFMLSSLGLFHIVLAWKDSIALRTGALFNLVGTALATLMLVEQQTAFAFHDKFKADDRGTVTDEQLEWMFREVNSIQLGMDLAWDIFISLGTFFFALSFWKHPVFGKGFTIAGVLVSVLLLSFNIAYFPEPPGEAGSIDFGPLVALWYTGLTGWMLVKRRNIVELEEKGLPR